MTGELNTLTLPTTEDPFESVFVQPGSNHTTVIKKDMRDQKQNITDCKKLERRISLLLKNERSKSNKWFLFCIIVTTLIIALLGILMVSESLSNKEQGLKVVSAQDEESLGTSIASTGSQVDAQEIKYEESTKTTTNTKFINNIRHMGKGAFQNSFTCSPSNGTTLNIYVKNNNSSGTVKFNVYHGTEEYGYIDVDSGKDITRTYKMTDGSGMFGDWKVYVTTSDGHNMDINVSAGTIR